MNIEIISDKKLRHLDRAEIIAMTSAAFGCNYDRFLQSFGRITHVVARDDGQIVSHALWCDRGLQPEGLPILRTAYVEAVVTLPDYQARGYASAVMRALAEKVQDYELAALGPSDPAFYTRLGWELWRGPLSVRVEDRLQPTSDHEVMILRLPKTPPLDLNAPLSVEWRELEVW
jgi:aminoglycoside 2'-N-acetyltransferase I